MEKKIQPGMVIENILGLQAVVMTVRQINSRTVIYSARTKYGVIEINDEEIPFWRVRQCCWRP